MKEFLNSKKEVIEKHFIYNDKDECLNHIEVMKEDGFTLINGEITYKIEDEEVSLIKELYPNVQIFEEEWIFSTKRKYVYQSRFRKEISLEVNDFRNQSK